MYRRKCFLAAVAAVMFVMPQSARATANAPAAPPPAANVASPSAANPRAPDTAGKDNNAPVKGPGQTLFSPFNDLPEDSTPHNKVDELVPYVGPTDQGSETSALDMPHRSQGEVADFLVHAITEMLSMGVDPTDKSRKKPWTYEDHLQMLSTGLDANALAQLGGFMEKSNILQILQANNQIMRIIVDDQPLLLNKGAVDGSYRWLYEVPVTLSFLKPGAKSYENAPTDLNQHVIIRMQVGRVPKKRVDHKEDPGIDEMMIQSFDVKQNPDYKHK